MAIQDYIVTIGLEVHCQIKTQSKMFCRCQNRFGDEPNSNVCPTCLGLPGALPSLNDLAIRKTLIAGLLLGCSAPEISKWDRKSYFYPDMPKNFQTSQFDLPLCIGGSVPLYDWAYPNEVRKNAPSPDKSIPLTRIHLEEDAGKLTHLPASTLLDYNRAGTPLMEIVSDPALSSADEAYAYLKSLQQIMINGDISDADMEKGQLRCDVNISLRPHGQTELGSKIELKNLNSISAVRRAIQFEIYRQAEELDMGIEQVQSTRRWDDEKGESFLMRTKEDAHDYRYFTCPDLVPIHTAPIIAQLAGSLPELPHQQRARYTQSLGISDDDAVVLISDRQLASFFEASAQGVSAPKKLASWITNVLTSFLREQDSSIPDSPLTPAHCRDLLDLIEQGIVSHNQSRDVLSALWQNPQLTAAAMASKLGFEPTDNSALDGWITEVIAENPAKVDEIRGGNEKLLNWMTGQVMKKAAGKTNPKLATQAIRKTLGLD